MVEYTEEEITAIINKAKNEQAALEQWTIMEDTLRRKLAMLVNVEIESGALHPFAKTVAQTMYSVNISGRNFAPASQEGEVEIPGKD